VRLKDRISCQAGGVKDGGAKLFCIGLHKLLDITGFMISDVIGWRRIRGRLLVKPAAETRCPPDRCGVLGNHFVHRLALNDAEVKRFHVAK
jgi:hypothetical protein